MLLRSLPKSACDALTRTLTKETDFAHFAGTGKSGTERRRFLEFVTKVR